MALRVVDYYIVGPGTLDDVASGIAARINLLDASSGIHSIAYIPLGDGSKVKGAIIHDTLG